MTTAGLDPAVVVCPERPRITIKRASATLLLGVLSLSAHATEYPEYDQAGNRYPQECRRDLSFIAARVIPVDDFPDPRMQALYVPSIGGKHDLILVRRSLAGWKRADAEQHERCHAQMLMLHPETGGQWHP